MASLEKSCKYEKQVILQQIQNLKQLNSFGAGYIDYADIEQWRDRFVFFLFHRWSYMNNAAHLSFGKGCEKNIQSKNLIFGDDLPRKKKLLQVFQRTKKKTKHGIYLTMSNYTSQALELSAKMINHYTRSMADLLAFGRLEIGD